MVQTLIANSGIQFFSREILMDANDGFRQVFYEWFDEEQVEQVLEYAYEIRQLDKDGFGTGITRKSGKGKSIWRRNHIQTPLSCPGTIQ